jgi:hypothetical protein
MDRRYLVATLALAATFAIFSHELRNGHVAVLARGPLAMVAGRCTQSSTPQRVADDLQARVRTDQAEEAQMLAEMNLPVLRAEARAQAREAALQASQEIAASKCARETALREAERARREAERARQEARRMQHDVALSVSGNLASPIVFQMPDLPRIEERVVINTDAVQRQLKVVKVRLAQEQIDRINNAVEVATANLDNVNFAPLPPDEATVNPKCPMSSAWSRQMQSHYTNAVRNALHSIHNSMNSAKPKVGTGSL